MQHDIGLAAHDLAHPAGVHRAWTSALWNTSAAAGLEFCGMDLRHPPITHIEPFGQLPQRSLAGSVRCQHLIAKIISVSARHSSRLNQKHQPQRIKSYT